MSERNKECRRCGENKPLRLFGTRKSPTGKVYPTSWCKSCKSHYSVERWVKNGKVPTWSAVRTAAEQRTPEQREAIRAMKERQRRKNGAPTREEIRLRAQKRKERLEREKEERRLEREAKCATRPPKMSPAELFRWRYQNDPKFQEKQKERTRAAKRKVPLWYANQQLGGTSEVRYPEALLLVKQMQIRIRHQLKEQDNEEH